MTHKSWTEFSDKDPKAKEMAERDGGSGVVDAASTLLAKLDHLGIDGIGSGFAAELEELRGALERSQNAERMNAAKQTPKTNED